MKNKNTASFVKSIKFSILLIKGIAQSKDKNKTLEPMLLFLIVIDLRTCNTKFRKIESYFPKRLTSPKISPFLSKLSTG